MQARCHIDIFTTFSLFTCLTNSTFWPLTSGANVSPHRPHAMTSSEAVHSIVWRHQYLPTPIVTLLDLAVLRYTSLVTPLVSGLVPGRHMTSSVTSRVTPRAVCPAQSCPRDTSLPVWGHPAPGLPLVHWLKVLYDDWNHDWRYCTIYPPSTVSRDSIIDIRRLEWIDTKDAHDWLTLWSCVIVIYIYKHCIRGIYHADVMLCGQSKTFAWDTVIYSVYKRHNIPT